MPKPPTETGRAALAAQQSAFARAVRGGDEDAALQAGLEAMPGPGRLAEPPSVAAMPLPLSAGLRAYQLNGVLMAQRALLAAYPRLAEWLGHEAMGALARDLWQGQPPQDGDINRWGACVVAALDAGVDAWAEWPWLADVARLEWALHQAVQAADAALPLAQGLHVLASAQGPDACLRLVAGTQLLALCFDVLPWMDDAQGSPLPRAVPGNAWVWRRGWQSAYTRVGAGDAAFGRALLAGCTVGQAHAKASSAEPAWAFAAWLQQALALGWVQAIEAPSAAPHSAQAG